MHNKSKLHGVYLTPKLSHIPLAGVTMEAASTALGTLFCGRKARSMSAFRGVEPLLTGTGKSAFLDVKAPCCTFTTLLTGVVLANSGVNISSLFFFLELKK